MRVWTLNEILKKEHLGYERWVSDEECRKALQEKVLEILEQDKEIERLRRLILMGRLWDEAPCCLCGYNGRGYSQPETHKCAKDYEEIFKEGE